VANELITAEPENGKELPTRRAALAGVGGACVLGLAGCSSYGQDAANVVQANPSNKPAASGGDAAAGDDGDKSSDDDAKPAKSIAAVSKIPVGGGLILKKEGIVLTQPKKGTIKAFSTTCTHAGCAVNKVADGTINCPCHGSKFAIEDGAPTDGPAPSPLETVDVKVKAKKVYLA
jgi:Rieske Fe-S protein